MIIQLHTPNGIVNVDSETVTDFELTELGMTRDTLNELVPRDLQAEIDGLASRIAKLEKKG